MRKNDDLAAWRLFFRIVETGSISKVANEANVQPSSISRRLTMLEKDIGFQLLRRTTRTITLTEIGTRAYKHMKLLFDDMDELIGNLADDAQNLSGNIRLSASISLGEFVLVKWLTSFQKEYPNINIDLVLENRYVDLLKEGIDLSFRIGPMTDEQVVAKRVGNVPFVMCASPEYLAKTSTPSHPNDLLKHQNILYSGFVNKKSVSFVQNEEIISLDLSSSFQVNNLTAIYQATLDGAGIHLLCPLWQCIENIKNGSLIEVLPSWEIPAAPVHIVRLPGRHTPRRVTALIDWITMQWHKTPGLE
jgi:LysR family transcriptional regulator, regulator for bpeEF and oprC